MPRVLPWELDEPKRERSTPERPIKRELGAQRSSTSTALSGRLNRTPSTSPVREPPSEELMINGLDADDQYIMVEDEFLSTARSFTAHLHRAEYTRKRKKAKTENASKVMRMTQRRPTDPKMSMNNATKKSIQRESSNMQRLEALEKMKEDAGRPQVDDSDMEETDDEDIGMSDEDRDDDPWVGTSLQALMVTAKQSRPLMGLQGIKSSTKAALGYSRPANTSGGVEKSLRDKGAGEASSDDDDLGVQARSLSRPPAIPARSKTSVPACTSKLTPVALPHKRDSTPSIARADPAPSPIKQPHVNIRESQSSSSGSSSPATRSNSAPKPRGSSSSRFAKFFDELDEPAKEPGSSPAKRQVKIEESDPTFDQIKTFQSEDAGEGKKLQKLRLNQVPTFL
ncbi:uncharacterized protein TERG_02275 [Trichophyton rubrum CBS 118892]|uniref:Uncharacterized protein n=1 Tax=Trichophyton rubrum (strain ATCC MYA-4607 / CBS 118892) TaxID=559305 RepID=F2SGF3_TRIRC|nr:uncharacterized protein TERG_02275 [Trichophyton rubrum CBS 118892]EGD86009.1 hypothetical protein TERG_02275 [Trichophyton rubrum CBS 118892]KMQ48583.1 hypothetical protein HL42_0625 [Trichophyton rubrum]